MPRNEFNVSSVRGQVVLFVELEVRALAAEIVKAERVAPGVGLSMAILELPQLLRYAARYDNDVFQIRAVVLGVQLVHAADR